MPQVDSKQYTSPQTWYDTPRFNPETDNWLSYCYRYGVDPNDLLGINASIKSSEEIIERREDKLVFLKKTESDLADFIKTVKQQRNFLLAKANVTDLRKLCSVDRKRFQALTEKLNSAKLRKISVGSEFLSLNNLLLDEVLHLGKLKMQNILFQG